MKEGPAQCRAYVGRVYTPVTHGGWLDIPRGALVVGREGVIEDIGEEREVLARNSHAKAEDCRDKLIVPGLVDCHQHLCHYDWMRLVRDLKQWLPLIYALEERFADPEYALDAARRFFNDLISNGTTTCCVHGPYYHDATDTAFEVAAESGLRVLMGMNAGDRNLPSSLSREAAGAVTQACDLHAKWNGAEGGLLSYCFTVRPAYCASPQLLSQMAQVATVERARIQCHLAEDPDGRRTMRKDLLDRSSETDVYDVCGLLRPATIMAHCLYLAKEDYGLLAERGVCIAHCPRANLLAGGRQLDTRYVQKAGCSLGLGTDLGAGKGLSMFRTMEDAMKVSPDLSVHDVFRLGTAGGAKALGLENCIGFLEVGYEADLLVLSPKLTQPEELASLDIEDVLSALIFRGDANDVTATYVRGRQLFPGNSEMGVER